MGTAKKREWNIGEALAAASRGEPLPVDVAAKYRISQVDYALAAAEMLRRIAPVHDASTRQRIEASANLIAGAMGLLGACRDTLTWLDEDTRIQCRKDTLFELLDSLRAAIAKAEGK